MFEHLEAKDIICCENAAHLVEVKEWLTKNKVFFEVDDLDVTIINVPDKNIKQDYSITEYMEYIKTTVCDHYCKWPSTILDDTDFSYDELWDQKCDGCPMDRLGLGI